MKKGFTLLELLIGIAIFAVIAGSVYASLRLGIKLYRQQETTGDDLFLAENVLEQIARDLTACFYNPENKRIRFKGSTQKLDFFSLERSGDVENVVYYLTSLPEQNRETLFVWRQKYTELDSGAAVKPQVVHRRIADLKFTYFDFKNKLWLESWSEEELPRQVKIELAIGQERPDAKPMALVRFVHIPVTSEIKFIRDESGE